MAGYRFHRAWQPLAPLLLIGSLGLSSHASPVALVSITQPGQSSATAGGTSVAPLLSADGRFVLFASTAENLAPGTNGLTQTFPAVFNAFCRDRTSNSTVLLSVNLTGSQGGNSHSFPSGISADGHLAVFKSSANDLLLGDTNGASDIFVRNLWSNSTRLISISTNGGFGNGASRDAVITPDGRFIAFTSAANNLVPNDTNGIPDVFVRDLQSGITMLASVGARSTPSRLSFAGSSESPDITPDGRYVAFYSTATNLVPGLTNVGDIYLRDLVAGTTVWASSGARAAILSAMNATNAVCFNHRLSSDGQFVVYEACPAPPIGLSAEGVVLRYLVGSGLTEVVATNAYVSNEPYEGIRTLDITPDGRFVTFVANTNGTSGTNTCILRWDGVSGLTSLVSADLSNSVPSGSLCDWPTIDSTGNLIAFLSNATNLTANPLNGDFHCYLRDSQAGTTLLIDADTNGTGSLLSPATIPRLSTNGQLVVFDAPGSTLTPNDNNHDFDVFARNLTNGMLELISARDSALPSVAANGISTLSAWSASADGRFVVFSSEADNLVPPDTNAFADIFLRDVLAGTNGLISRDTNGIPANGASSEPSISADGRFIAFTSLADNLVAGDTNRALDVFLHDRLNGTTTLVSISTNGVNSGNNPSYSPLLSVNAKYVLFRSKANNLALGSQTVENLFLRNLQTATTSALTTNGVSAAAMTPDGHFILFVIPGVTSRLNLWDSQLNMLVYTNPIVTMLDSLAVSPDGNRFAFRSGSQMTVLDRAANTNWTLGLSASGPRATAQFSADNRFLTYAGPVQAGGSNQIFLYDFQNGTNLMLTRALNTLGPANSLSDSPTISSDGRFVAYRSAASDLAPGDTNGLPDLFLFDRIAGATTLLTVSLSNTSPANGYPRMPVFTGDSRTLVFQSWASTQVAYDFNQSSDIFDVYLYPSNAIAPFSIEMFPSATPSSGLVLSWSVVPGSTYVVQYKNSLDESEWRTIAEGVVLVGDRGYFVESAPLAGQRFYRLAATSTAP